MVDLIWPNRVKGSARESVLNFLQKGTVALNGPDLLIGTLMVAEQRDCFFNFHYLLLVGETSLGYLILF